MAKNITLTDYDNFEDLFKALLKARNIKNLDCGELNMTVEPAPIPKKNGDNAMLNVDLSQILIPLIRNILQFNHLEKISFRNCNLPEDEIINLLKNTNTKYLQRLDLEGNQNINNYANYNRQLTNFLIKTRDGFQMSFSQANGGMAVNLKNSWENLFQVQENIINNRVTYAFQKKDSITITNELLNTETFMLIKHCFQNIKTLKINANTDLSKNLIPIFFIEDFVKLWAGSITALQFSLNSFQLVLENLINFEKTIFSLHNLKKLHIDFNSIVNGSILFGMRDMLQEITEDKNCSKLIACKFDNFFLPESMSQKFLKYTTDFFKTLIHFEITSNAAAVPVAAGNHNNSTISELLKFVEKQECAIKLDRNVLANEGQKFAKYITDNNQHYTTLLINGYIHNVATTLKQIIPIEIYQKILNYFPNQNFYPSIPKVAQPADAAVNNDTTYDLLNAPDHLNIFPAISYTPYCDSKITNSSNANLILGDNDDLHIHTE